MAKLVGRLSSYQIRAHYEIYNAVQQTIRVGPEFEISDAVQLRELAAIYVPWSTLSTALGIDSAMAGHAVMGHIVHGLLREALVDDELFAYGPKADISAFVAPRTVPEDGLLVAPTFAGIELFFWAHGYCNLTERALRESSVVFAPATSIRPTDDCLAVWQLEKRAEQQPG